MAKTKIAVTVKAEDVARVARKEADFHYKELLTEKANSEGKAVDEMWKIGFIRGLQHIANLFESYSTPVEQLEE